MLLLLLKTSFGKPILGNGCCLVPDTLTRCCRPVLCPGMNVRKAIVTAARAFGAVVTALGASELLPTKELLPPEGKLANLITHWVSEQPVKSSGGTGSVSDPAPSCR